MPQLCSSSQRHLGVGILTLHGRLLLLPDRCMAAAFFHFVLLLMLSSLYFWCRQDLAITFSDLTYNITDAVVMKK